MRAPRAPAISAMHDIDSSQPSCAFSPSSAIISRTSAPETTSKAVNSDNDTVTNDVNADASAAESEAALRSRTMTFTRPSVDAGGAAGEVGGELGGEAGAG